MPTECSAKQFAFEPQDGRQVVSCFDGGAVTSNGGAVLLREADRRIGLTSGVARCFSDGRDPDRVVHPLKTLLAQRIHAIALGYEDLNDHDTLRFDPALALLADTADPRRADAATLAGKSTLNRLEHQASRTAGSGAQTAAAQTAAAKVGDPRYHKFSVDEAAMDQLFLDLYVAAHPVPPKRIILDLDATDDPLHGNQEGRFFHGYYGGYCYLPLYIFDGRHLLLARLRRANIDAAAGAKDEIARITAHLRTVWPTTEIWLRADSGFARDELMTWCEANGIGFVFGLARNKRLQAMLADDLVAVEAEHQKTKQPARIFKELTYRTLDSWSRERRVVGKAEHLEKGANPRFIVTSLPPAAMPGKDLYEAVYCARGEMENRIKECQLDLYADRTSAATMRANQLRLWFASLAYVLMEALRRLALHGSPLARASAGTIRLQLLKIGAVVTRSVRRVKLAFATACPARDTFALAHQRLAAPPGR